MGLFECNATVAACAFAERHGECGRNTYADADASRTAAVASGSYEPTYADAGGELTWHTNVG